SALDVDAANRRGAYAQANLRAFGNGRVTAAVRHPHQPFGLVDEIGEFRARTFKAGGVDVGDVVRDHLQVLLLGAHARRRDRQRSHFDFLRYRYEPGRPARFKIDFPDQIAMRVISWNAATALSRIASTVCSERCAAITDSTTFIGAAAPSTP